MRQTRREFVRVLFVASSGFLAERSLAANLIGKQATALLPSLRPEGLNFLVFGDWGRQGEQDQLDVAAQMARVAKSMDARFVVSVGDNFYEDGVASTKDDHWRRSFEDVYHQGPLQVPWHVALGNHDYHGDCDAQVAYSHVDPRWNMPARYFKFLKQSGAVTTEFFVLDTTPMVTKHHDDHKATPNAFKEDVPKQMAWFRESLAASKADWKIVIGHHPIYSGGEHGDTPELVESILPLLREHGVQVYFNGHDHDLQHLKAGDINLICSGAGSKVRPTKSVEQTKFALGVSGFTAVSVQKDRMDLRMLDRAGTQVYATSFKRAAA
jgi:tartrate-resistant acid phosphatase type 5